MLQTRAIIGMALAILVMASSRVHAASEEHEDWDLRQDRFERTSSIRGETLNNLGGGYMNDYYAREFWRFVDVQRLVVELARTAVEFPPMQAPASFNLDEIKTKVQEMIKKHEAQ